MSYELYKVVGRFSQLSTNESDSVQLVRLMAASNSLLVLHRFLFSMRNAKDKEGDFLEFESEYLNSTFVLLVGLLKEALDAFREADSLFVEIEKKCEKVPSSDQLPVERRKKLSEYARNESMQRQIIKDIRDSVGYHWSHSQIVGAIANLGDDPVTISKVVHSPDYTFVCYSIADQLLENAGFTSDEAEKEKRVVCVRDVMLEFLHVTSHYLPAHFHMCGLRGEESW